MGCKHCQYLEGECWLTPIITLYYYEFGYYGKLSHVFIIINPYYYLSYSKVSQGPFFRTRISSIISFN